MWSKRCELKKPTDSEYKNRENAKDDIVTYFTMFISMGILGIVVLIKLFTNN